ncbi:MAG: hypothetical protein KDJ29_09695 [Hyphomicrobiales bacterium]|nr:hypothetical protein [Hyphomicrobiales bacterium]
MLNLINAYLASRWWDATTSIAAIAGGFCVIWTLMGGPQTPKQRLTAWLGIGFLATTILFSMIFEELLPMARRKPWTDVARAALGMAGFATATVLLVFGGRGIIRSVLAGWPWKPGLLLSAGSIALFVIASFIYHA